MTFFILGSHPELSVAEIFSLIGEKPIVARLPHVLIVDEVEQHLEALQTRLAGSVKIGSIIGELESWHEEETASLMASFITETAGKQKMSFGVSGYGIKRERLLSLGKRIKQSLKTTGRPIRYVTSKQEVLSSVIVKENGLLSSGGEFAIFKTADKYLLGQTQTIQDYKLWSQRDFGRPRRDAKSGLLPPKLARIMLNLSATDPKQTTILDPFCGSGTILMEAILMGYKRIIGSDISEKAIQDSAENLTWLVDHFDLAPPAVALHITDVVHLSEFVQERVDVIVTETFLGEPKFKPLSDAEFRQTIQQLFSIFKPSFSVLKERLKPDGTCVIAVPAFQTFSGIRRINIDQFLEEIGFKIVNSFLYHRPGQIVVREIFVLRHSQSPYTINSNS